MEPAVQDRGALLLAPPLPPVPCEGGGTIQQLSERFLVLKGKRCMELIHATVRRRLYDLGAVEKDLALLDRFVVWNCVFLDKETLIRYRSKQQLIHREARGRRQEYKKRSRVKRSVVGHVDSASATWCSL